MSNKILPYFNHRISFRDDIFLKDVISFLSNFSLVVIQERKSRYCQLRIIQNLKPNNFKNTTNRILRVFENVKSLTLDNGIENIRHDQIKTKTFFCNPYSSWEKGGVENLNKMVRRFVPKGSDISTFSVRRIKRIENILNTKPRKILGYKSSKEVALEDNLLKV